MRLNVKPFFDSDSLKKGFSDSVSLLPEVFGGAIAADQAPVSVSGHLQAKMGAVTADWRITATLKLRCDRCLCEFAFPFSGEFTHRLLRHWKEGQDDAAILLEQDYLDLDRAVSEDIFLNLPTKLLCNENCRGLCPVCGINRNHETCHCEAE